jgi:hypothetical protein
VAYKIFAVYNCLPDTIFQGRTVALNCLFIGYANLLFSFRIIISQLLLICSMTNLLDLFILLAMILLVLEDIGKVLNIFVIRVHHLGVFSMFESLILFHVSVVTKHVLGNTLA